MSNMAPILWLILGLQIVASLVLWACSIFVAVRLARRSGRRAWPWALLATLAGLVTGGTLCLATGYLAHNYRRRVLYWVLEAIFFVALAVGAAIVLLPRWFGSGLVADTGLLLAVNVAAVLPLISLGLIGPSGLGRVEANAAGPLVQAVKVEKAYMLGRRRLRVLRGVSLSVKRGEFVAVLGASGSGKSTLLHVMGLLDSADDGQVVLHGTDSALLTSAQRDRIRCRDIGFVFQFYHLLPELNVMDNVLLPVRTSVGPLGWLTARGPARRRAAALLDRLGLSERLRHRPRELSGGEQQRVAIARALVNTPALLLADEPTGNLDSATGRQIIDLLKQLNQDTDQTIVMVTHDESLASKADRIVRLRDGRLV